MPQSTDFEDGLSATLVRLLAQEPETWSLRRLWSWMPLSLREEAVAEVLAVEAGSEVREALLDELAAAAGFRRQTLERMEPAQAARLVVRLPSRKLPRPGTVLPHFLTSTRSELLGAYLDELGVPHDDGVIPEDHQAVVEAEEARQAAEGLLARFPPDDVIVYLVTLVLTQPHLAPGLSAWLHVSRGALAPAEGPEETPGASVAEGTDPDTPEPELVREARRAVPEEGTAPGEPFSALDRTLIRAAVDSVQGVVGAPEPATMEDMVQEVLELNSARHSSYFHRGFLDALTDQAYREGFPAENVQRRSWYLVGWLSGLARQGRSDDIVAVMDDDPDARALQNPRAEWAALALPLLFRALCRAGREPEGAQLLSPEYLLHHNPTLLPELLHHGTRLLRDNHAEKARPLFQRLGEVVEGLEAHGEPVTEGFFLEIRRRRAHCYRQLGEAERARELLERLLEEERDADIQAMVLADLGLLDAGFRSLAEVRLWRSESERADHLDALERGRVRFEAAADTHSRFAAHGRWPLAVRAMALEEWERARELLSSVASSFMERPDRYGDQRLLARVKVAAGIAEAMVMDYTRLVRARDLLEAGLEEGARIPRPLLPSVLAALEAHEEDLAGTVLTRVLEVEGPEVLDELGGSEAVRRTPAVATHLLDHAADPEVKAVARARALRRALPILLSEHPPRRERARKALDELEGLAREGVGWEAFVELLSDPEQVDLAWSREDAAWARIAILKARESYQEAVQALRERLAEVLASPGWAAEEEAEAIVARARSYGLDPEWTRELEDRFAAWQREFGEDEQATLPPTHPHQPHRILIVGGDERQHGLRDRVLARLEADGAHVRLEHIPTGWSGNWSHTLDRAVAAAERHDAVVLLRYMRTEFGRSLRAALDCPWVSCPGVGTLQVARMVRKAAGFARARRE